LAGVGAGDVEPFVAAETRRQRDEVVEVLHAARQHVEQILRHDRLFAGVARVDQRRLAAHRHRFRQRPDLHVRVHRGGEADVSSIPSRRKPLKPVIENVTV
jgi:hypothetical protein